MLAPTPLQPIEALLGDDPSALDDDALRGHVGALVRAQAQVDAALLTAVTELDHRDAYVADLVLLCRRHHKEVHRGIIKFVRDEPAGCWVLVVSDNTPLRR